MRIFTVVLAIILSIVSIYLAFYYSRNADHDRLDLDSERYLRMVSEENLLGANKKIDSLQDAISRKEAKISSLEKLIEQKNILNKTMESKLQELNVIKKTLELRISELEKKIDLLISQRTQGQAAN